MRVTAGGIAVAGVGAVALYLLTRERTGVFRPVTPDATNAYWGSSLGDLTLNAMDWYTNGWGNWGDGWEWQYTGDAAADLQTRFENGSYSTL